MISNRDRVIRRLAELLGITPEEVTERFPCIDELVANSADIEELLLELEEEFGGEDGFRSGLRDEEPNDQN